MVSANADIVGLVKENINPARGMGETMEEIGKARVDPGTGRASSECVVMLPEAAGRYACSLF
jgi:hypothetical protein